MFASRPMLTCYMGGNQPFLLIQQYLIHLWFISCFKSMYIGACIFIFGTSLQLPRTMQKCWCVGYYRIDKNNTRKIPVPRSGNMTVSVVFSMKGSPISYNTRNIPVSQSRNMTDVSGLLFPTPKVNLTPSYNLYQK